MTTVIETADLKMEAVERGVNPFDLSNVNGITSTPFGYFDIKAGEVIAFSNDGLVWEVANEDQLSFRLDEIDY